MENASKALIMATEIIVGLIIISIGVYLFQVFSNYSETNYKEIEQAQISEFNNRFLKYVGTIRDEETGTTRPIECTIHDIVSLANFAQKHNTEQGIVDEERFSNNTMYVQIDLGSNRNIEKYNNSQIVNLIKENDLVESHLGEVTTKYYECVEYRISDTTGRVNYIRFREVR